ncbi:hypothetical protein M406DRAFT_350335 [Cryphonectria parasitica EP155]|uniref:Uncharacterized protein n=1 Tax=Cryphonectria parasitica (strain ATCC 38755 / EP155) TaxID=660469 RepID=A0A9P4Y4U4_CRYP1|nr:uncharacterized protein M406DRAFT_350335 [Cryphonectria parasitica EP155]KAF3766942.1 hypothetical protein M406DRAFT_350335 [Cryphonectria parasitica EP155]
MFAAQIPALALFFMLISLLLSPVLTHDPRGQPVLTPSRQDDGREPVVRSLAVTDGSSSTWHSRMAFRRADDDGGMGSEGRDPEALNPRNLGSVGTTAAAYAKDHHQRSAPVATSAAPKVLGINIYVMIAWLGLLYLMYRTGSMF